MAVARRSRHRALAKPKDELAFDGGLRIVVGDDSGFEGLVVLGIFQGADHGLGGEAMAHGVAAGQLSVTGIGLLPIGPRAFAPHCDRLASDTYRVS